MDLNKYFHLLSAEDQAKLRPHLEEADKRKAEALARGDGEGYLAFFGSHERLHPFVQIRHALGNEDYWRLLADVWTRIEVSYPDRALWVHLFNDERPGREAMMDAKERATLASLPGRVTIYRGYRSGRARRGLSWTLSCERAIHFAVKVAGDKRRAYHGYDAASRAPMLATGWCRRGDVWAYLNGRTEEEIVIHPDKVFGLRSSRLPPA